MPDIESQTDGELLAAFAAAGVESAFAEIMRRHGTMVQGVALRVLGDHHEAQDVTQATFLTLARKARALRKDPSVGGWLHRVAWCLARDVRSARISRRRREEEAMRMQETTATAAAESAAVSAAVDAAVAALPERYHQPVVLFHLERHSLEETAARLELNSKTASTRLVRGRELLRRGLARQGFAALSAGALTALLSAETGAAVLPAAFVSATVKAASLAAAGKLAAGVSAGAVSAQVAALSKGAIQMILIAQLKTAAVIVVATAVVTGAGGVIAQRLAASQKTEPPPALAPKPPAPAGGALPVDEKIGQLLEKPKGFTDALPVFWLKSAGDIQHASVGMVLSASVSQDGMRWDPPSWTELLKLENIRILHGAKDDIALRSGEKEDPETYGIGIHATPYRGTTPSAPVFAKGDKILVIRGTGGRGSAVYAWSQELEDGVVRFLAAPKPPAGALPEKAKITDEQINQLLKQPKAWDEALVKHKNWDKSAGALLKVATEVWSATVASNSFSPIERDGLVKEGEERLWLKDLRGLRGKNENEWLRQKPVSVQAFGKPAFAAGAKVLVIFVIEADPQPARTQFFRAVYLSSEDIENAVAQFLRQGS